MAGVVLVVALSGLGCQNKSCDTSVAPAGYYPSGQAVPHVHTGYAAPSGYQSGSASHSGGDPYGGYGLHSSIRSTLWSFLLGRDPDGVPTVAEIEAGLQSGNYAYSAVTGGYNARYSAPIGASSR
jgi:hypothetical protein